MTWWELVLSAGFVGVILWAGKRYYERPTSGEDWLGQEYGPCDPEPAHPPIAAPAAMQPSKTDSSGLHPS